MDTLEGVTGIWPGPGVTRTLWVRYGDIDRPGGGDSLLLLELLSSASPHGARAPLEWFYRPWPHSPVPQGTGSAERAGRAARGVCGEQGRLGPRCAHTRGPLGSLCPECPHPQVTWFPWVPIPWVSPVSVPWGGPVPTLQGLFCPPPG